MIYSPLTPDPQDFIGVLQLKGIKTRKDIIHKILSKNVGLAESELMAVFEEEDKAIKEFIEEGYTVDTGSMYLKTTMKGVFHNANETFNKDKHALGLNIRPKKALKEVLKKIELMKVINNKTIPVLMVFEDLISKTNNETATPGKTAKIFGDKLKFDAEDTEQGIFFIKENKTKIQVDKYVEVGNKKLIFNIPEGLKSGNYRLQVSGKTAAGEVRTGTLRKMLAVA